VTEASLSGSLAKHHQPEPILNFPNSGYCAWNATSADAGLCASDFHEEQLLPVLIPSCGREGMLMLHGE